MTSSASLFSGALVLAAGRSSRMKSAISKVWHPLAGRPVILHILDTLQALGVDRVGVVVRPDQHDLKDALGAAGHTLSPEFFEQQEPLGTGHAVQCAAGFFSEAGRSLVLCGDTPLIQAETLGALGALTSPLALVAMPVRAGDPGARSYGRCQVQGAAVKAIVEARDDTTLLADGDTLWCNAGVYAADHGVLNTLLPRLQPSAATGELYLTDLVQLAVQAGYEPLWAQGSEAEFLGINTRQDLARAEAVMQGRLRQKAMEKGCTLVDPASVFFAWDTEVNEDVTIGPSVVFGPGVVLEPGARVEAFCALEGARVGEGVVVGPFARLRPGTVLHRKVRIGNFVEVKNSTLHAGAKANHLAYLGDAEIGAKTNIGAGTITCNYDGFAKHPTRIGAGVQVGANTSLVAPVMLGDGAVVGAGSVVTRDVPPDALAVARAPLQIRPEAALRLRAKRQKKA
jgi:bifunctional UDP-N-acetylglucosamine pyrophosphorylase/glucosamine-1-phosphate N-acetyltransferase